MSSHSRNPIILIILAFFLTATASAQGLLIKDKTGSVVNNDTLTYYK